MVAAFKFARKYARTKFPDKPKFGILSFSNAFHGRTMGALSATPNKKYQAPFVPMLPGFVSVPFNDIKSVDKLDDSFCAVIVEPIQGEGGVHPASVPFLTALRNKCDDVGALMIADEIQVNCD
jgi:acetylornithine aminotransferase